MCQHVPDSHFFKIVFTITFYFQFIIICVPVLSYLLRTINFFRPELLFLFLLVEIYLHTPQFTHVKYSIQWTVGIFTELCDHYQFQNISITPKGTLYPPAVTPHLPNPPEPYITIKLLSVSTDLPILDISYTRNNTICSLL